MQLQAGKGGLGCETNKSPRLVTFVPLSYSTGPFPIPCELEELAHTLDVTASGIRLGSVRRELSALDELTIFFRQRKMRFRIVWTKKMKGTTEFQVGLQALTQDKDVWGLTFVESSKPPAQSFSASQASSLA